MMSAGHVLIGPENAIFEVDVGFCDLLRTDPQALTGRLIAEITAPADREECGRALDRLRATGRSFDITKRLVRDDSSLVWVRNAVSIMSGPQSGLIVATCSEVESDRDRQSPALLLKAARKMRDLEQMRSGVCISQIGSAPGWLTLLEIYIAEAEGRSADVSQLSVCIEQSASVTGRWIAALAGHGVVEIETRNPSPDTAKAYRLTSSSLKRLELYLASHSLGDDAVPQSVMLGGHG
jgi:hypothetical protein